MTDVTKCDRFFNIPHTIWIVGLGALLTNFSSIIVFSLTPIYLTQIFGLTTFHLGILEGFVEFSSWSIRIFSGFVSDFFKKRKLLLVGAYSLTTLTRPIFALAPNVGWIFSARLLDRISNGLQAAPREALVGDVAPKGRKGACYGLRQSLGFVGSIAGAFSIMLLMPCLHNNIVTMYWIAAIPSVFALLAIVCFVSDAISLKQGKLDGKQKSVSTFVREVVNLDSSFWMLILVAGFFMLSNYSGAYRILQANKIGIPPETVSLVMLVQNIGALSGFPVGRMADKYDRRILLVVGCFITILANLFLGFMPSVLGVLIGSTLWGVQMSMTQSVFQVMIADTVQRNLLGTGFGIYYFVIACALFVANFAMGYVYEAYGPTTAFMSSAFVASISVFLIGTLKPCKNMKQVVSST